MLDLVAIGRYETRELQLGSCADERQLDQPRLVRAPYGQRIPSSVNAPVHFTESSYCSDHPLHPRTTEQLMDGGF